jgi:branched-chain amino acid transport system substrate-binding protein
MSKTFDLGVLYSRSGTYQLLSEALFTGAMSAIESVNANDDLPVFFTLSFGTQQGN